MLKKIIFEKFRGFRSAHCGGDTVNILKVSRNERLL